MDKSVFTVRNEVPDEKALKKVLENSYDLWISIVEYVKVRYPAALCEWNYPGEKYGWSFRIKDKKRAIIYLLPREKYFKTAFVFGQKAADEIFQSRISETIKFELKEARQYAEGRGIRINIKDNTLIRDIKTLIDIKLAH